MYKNQVLGKQGENITTHYLIQNNYKILERNFNCYFGEIDIIAKDKKEIVFIEVKTRSGIDFGQPSEAVNKLKQKHMYRAAQYFLYKSNYINNFIRFDVMEVLVKDGKFNVNHIKQII